MIITGMTYYALSLMIPWAWMLSPDDITREKFTRDKIIWQKLHVAQIPHLNYYYYRNLDFLKFHTFKD